MNAGMITPFLDLATGKFLVVISEILGASYHMLLRLVVTSSLAMVTHTLIIYHISGPP